VNKWTYSKKYAMSLLDEIFDALGQAKVFNTLDLRFTKGGDKVKTTFWGIDPHGKDYLYHWKFLPFDYKISKGHGLSVSRYWFCQMLCQ